MKKQDEERVVLRRGLAEHDWRTPGYQPPSRAEGFRWRSTLEPTVTTAPPPDKSHVWARRMTIAAAGLAGIVVTLAVLATSFQGFQARGVSMEPTLNNGDRIIVNRLAYSQIDFGLLDWAPLLDVTARWASPERGDIIVFDSPADSRELVKRVIGLPGEEVEIKDGAVYIDGTRLDEPHAQGQTLCFTTCIWVVPRGHYFVLGDNREDSRDSRDGWMVPIANIDGKKFLSY